MNDEMKKALLEVCEKHTNTISKETIDFVYELIEVAIKTSETPIDDMFLPILNATKPVLENFVHELVDKIDGIEGNLE